MYRSLELLGGDNSTLPVVLSSFTAEYVAQYDHVELAWVTQSEDGNEGWNLYRGESAEAMINGDVIILNEGLIPGAGTSTVPTYYDFTDDYTLVSGTTYWYWLESVAQSGEIVVFDPISVVMPLGTTPELPNVTTLKGNYPNPFNPATEIAYSIKAGERGVLSIYNAKGQKVHRVELEAGNGSYRWEAKDQASGIYFYKLKTDSFSSTKKMLLLK
ncbi:MAG TPA: T9SS type A sorting domain-containing protein [Candidatus Cloacimonadota bacterium]|nr:T9SS type A sorting domain-containing protein [Candidatus Cloacimonadota bacterium]